MFVWIPVVSSLLAVLLAAAAAWTDLRTGRIPNKLTLAGFAVGLLLQVAAGHFHVARTGFGGNTALGGLAMGLVGAVVAALPFLALFYKNIDRRDGSRENVGGGGDVKLMAALGAMVGYYRGVELLFFSLCAAAIFAGARLAWHGRLLAALANSLFITLNPVLPRKWRRDITADLLHKMRIGGAILAGTLVSVVLNQPL